ncbi:MAG: hypothetical protein ACP5J0_00860 [Pyrobaculum sp.]
MHVVGVYEILKRLGEADLDELVEVAYREGIPPPVATRAFMRLIERGEVEVICGVTIRYRPR